MGPLIVCEQSLFFFRFSEGSARAHERRETRAAAGVEKRETVPIHFSSDSLLQRSSASLVKKTRSALRLRHQRKMVLLLRKLLKPFTLSDISLKALNN